MNDTPTIHDTARSLLAYFGTMAEWGETSAANIHRATPELMALVCAILDLVPAAWHPYSPSLERDDGYVVLYQPTADREFERAGSYDRSVSVHSVPRPPRYVDRDPGQVAPIEADRAVVAALVGLASMRAGRQVADLLNGPGCARVMATLTDEEIERAEQSDLGGESEP